MIAAEDVALVLLAAGKSTRFGDSKLDALLGDQPLGLHAAITFAAIPFARRIAVTGRCQLDYSAHGYAVVTNDDPVGDMASSLRLGIAAAGDAAAVLVMLADMPRVTAAHVGQMLEAADGPDAIVASSDGGVPRPPALFGRAWFATLATITGDHGARDLIRSGKQVAAQPGELVDIDTPEDLQRLAT
ncbi:nucleotidyltransferase family protein [Sphingomonas radiodurans]|uniref:nucleotidyltransferase family protein n=1 Tax=Sphingomonas radiodurans TaxID=2890321 RepID=UPI001E35F87E|nr:nucleotidyltransferase family protein [Sphingomonas radiodurans]WBH17708.1 nucleotidyltransferase family protein [Sphingomonas radiodurans]